MIETTRLRLRQCQSDDARFIQELFSQPECIEFIGDKGLTELALAEQYIKENLQASYQEHGYGLYLMELKSSGERIGLCGLVKRDYLQLPDLGFALLSQYTGKGLMLEASKAVLYFCQQQLGLDELLAITKPHNLRSIQLLTKLNFKQVILASKREELSQVNTFHLDLVESLTR
ncbi:GNAT family N-acetyltransferase [Pseudoalteromonas rubra]|uniref:GNAT family N-acetyltransferase n=1 Tax=Pseudoalteromonas rubra TaxID=43658 RepID=UPI0005F9E450|nr:GNAT family N-acetyltransferase [Pseudoalteromonas rubra]